MNHKPKGTNMRTRHGLIAVGLALSALLLIPAPAQAMYQDGMNLYQYVQSNPSVLVDPNGLASKPCCICATEPGKCSIKVKWGNSTGSGASRGAYYYPNNRSQKYQLKFQLFTTITLLHSGGKDLKGCHLQQDTQGVSNILNPPNWTTAEDYSSKHSAKNRYYHEWWFEDSPYTISKLNERPTFPKTIWWQAHVFVEEANAVETWWGYAGTVVWDDENKTNYGFTNWREEKKLPFSVLPPNDLFKNDDISLYQWPFKGQAK